MIVSSFAALCCGVRAVQKAEGEQVPAFSMGLATFQKGVVPGKGEKRDYWHLGKGWQWSKGAGRKDKFCLAVEQPTAGVTEARARTPMFGRADHFIFPEYIISAWVKTEKVVGKGVSVGFVAERPRSGAHFYAPPLAGTHDWTRVSFVTRLPCQVWKGRLVLRLEGAGKAWVDDVDFWYRIPGYKSGPVPGSKEVLDLKDGWVFRTDPKGKGLEEKWEKTDLDDADWKPIGIDKGWDPQGYEKYDGLGWYRIRFRLPEGLKGKHLFITFEAVDEDAYVWLNGAYLGRHFGWDAPFHFEVTDKIKLGGENIMVVLAYDTIYQGGIWKPVKVVSLDGEKGGTK